MKKAVKIAAVIFIPLYICVFLLFFFPGSGDNQGGGKKAAAVIAELWHVDLFEGGSGSRGEFLKQQAINFEKTKNGYFIIVKNMTYEQMLNSLAEGRRPDMFSYGAGAACDIIAELRAFGGTVSCYENLINSGAVEDKVFAVPWSCGGYIIAAVKNHLSDENADFVSVLASSEKQKGKNGLFSFTTGYSFFNNPLMAAYIANNSMRLTEKSFDSTKTYTQYEAYSKFVSKNSSVFLLGTQRDAVRISSRENSADFLIQAVKGFSDIVCYISIARDSAAYEICRDYIEYLLSETVQRKMAAISMFSVNTAGLYSEGVMKEIEAAVPDFCVLNVFMSKQLLAESRITAFNALKGDGEAAKKIREILPNDLN